MLFATPKGTIIETEQQHKLEEHIKIDKPEAKFKDNKDLDLYAGQVNVNLTVTDTYSGIEKLNGLSFPHMIRKQSIRCT